MTNNNFQEEFENIELGEMFEELIKRRIDYKGGIHIDEIRDDIVDYHLGITKDLLAKKDQDHKAELEAIRAEMEDGRIQDSELEHLLTVVAHNDVIDDALLILDKRINK